MVEKQEGKLSQYGRVKLFSGTGISGLQANSFQKPSERQEICLSTPSLVCPLQKEQAFSNPSLCTVGWVREVRGWQSLCVRAQWKFPHLAQRMGAEGLLELRVPSSLQAFPHH